MNRIVAPRHPPCHLIDLNAPPYPFIGFGELAEAEMVLNQHDLTLNLVLFEPGSESTSGWKLGILLHQRDEAPTTEMLSRLYGELANLEMAFKCPKFLEDLLEIRAQDTNHG